METVIAVLMDDEKEDEQACADADGKTADVDSAVQAVTDKDSPGCFEIVQDHVGYSVFRLCEGFILAVRKARKLTVYRAIKTASRPADKNMSMLIAVR